VAGDAGYTSGDCFLCIHLLLWRILFGAFARIGLFIIEAACCFMLHFSGFRLQIGYCTRKSAHNRFNQNWQ